MSPSPRSNVRRPIVWRPIVWRAITRAAAAAGTTLVVLGVVGGALAAHPASATVVHALGYQATVDGWTSWYGSYGMGGLGPAWCIDHGIPAPDPSYGYGPSVVADHAAVTTRAMAWALGAYGPGADRPTAAALTLVLHDLAGAVYPLGRMDLDRVTVGRLAGFGGAETQVLSRAEQIKRDAVAHAGLVPPLRLTATRAPGQPAAVVAVTDRSGQPVSDAPVAEDGAGGAGGRTDGAGRIRLPAGEGVVGVTATVPGLDLDAFAPARTVAQRVARPAVVRLHVTLAAVAPSTTTTSTPPSTTTTVAHPAVVRAPTPTSTTAPPPIAASAVPAPAPPQLPFTGAPVRPLLLIGLGLALTGGAAVLGSRPPQPRQSAFETT